ncbi:hypothetical protein DXV76_02580 [Rhodobacteraceae bacterium CCMM004]|nr:hypothetical protein DXV76_02580 [Rhodobacteraceae bacterium CCMM004]
MDDTAGWWGIDARIWQAVLAGLFVAAGWLVNGWQNRREEAARRAERLRDTHRALYAEIGAYLGNLGSLEALEAARAAMVARMRAEPDFVPFLAREEHGHLYRAIVADIAVLPRSSIDTVVAFYTQLGVIAALVEDMRGPGYAALSTERRIAIYEDLARSKMAAWLYGREALDLIDIYARHGAQAARDRQDALRAARVNSPEDAAPDGPSRGGGSA